ncbi:MULTISPECIES: GNAT family N-acetyltransferase [unclassified Streptomyces]|uniref:GNAT family N-acetyltransferase n=1 Tax=unclassified Streptomyces TaxID=2593676 RepID=UPI00224D8EAE|nr:GNAT family N-acetyltransferase [Streptomyces sp. NBC_01500]MCX4551846.1 GNAT family N-acetyltransferase [Streptomyces sp. NBC_01500]WSV57121.1 GNAT family N-acetyltransferase [Streptomyces sp. NBC_01014]
MDIVLRAVEDADLPVIFAHMSDPVSNHMAAFTCEDPTDRAYFDAHWKRIRASDAVLRTVLADGAVVGHTAVYGPPDERSVTYTIGRAHWGRGIATAALRALLALVPERPLYARAAADNPGSARVLEKCGFVVTGRNRDFAHSRGAETDELLFTLPG